MKVKSVEKLEKSRVALIIEADAQEFEGAIEKAYRKQRSRIMLPGFRKGKAPRKMIEAMYGAEIFYEDAVNEIYPELFDQAVEQEGLDTVAYPEVELLDAGKEGFSFKATVAVRPEVTLGDYKGLTAPKSVEKVTEKDIDEVLKIVRLNEARKKMVNHYSLGMKQRLGLAAALLGFPKLLILDEPTNGLDPAGIQEMRELICSLPGAYGMTVLVSSHLLSEIDQMADHVGIIRKGELVYQNTLESLHAHSKEQIAIRVSHTAIALDLLRQDGIEATQEDGYLLLPMVDDTYVANLCRLLVAQNISLYRIEKREKSLEDIFLSLTGKESSL